MNNNRHLIIGGAVLVIIILGVVFWMLQNKGGKIVEVAVTDEERGMKGEPVDVVLDFYGAWLAARKSSEIDPYSPDLINSKALSVETSKKLVGLQEEFRKEKKDPVPLPVCYSKWIPFENSF